jgi:hypothetical protein
MEVTLSFSSTSIYTPGCFSHRVLTHLVSSQLGAPVSTYTVARILNSDLWTGVIPKPLPINNEKQQKQRKDWCDANLDNTFGGRESSCLYIDIDEKYFESWKSRVRYFPCVPVFVLPSDTFQLISYLTA